MKRVFISEDEYVDLPPALVQALERCPVQKRRETPAEYRANRPVKAYANPRAAGYGGGQTPWPFDREKAIQDGRYRAGVSNAINADWTAQNWKAAALDLLDMVHADIAEAAYHARVAPPRPPSPTIDMPTGSTPLWQKISGRMARRAAWGGKVPWYIEAEQENSE